MLNYVVDPEILTPFLPRGIELNAWQGLTQLRDVTGPPEIFAETAHYDGMHSAHNIVIIEETGTA